MKKFLMPLFVLILTTSCGGDGDGDDDGAELRTDVCSVLGLASRELNPKIINGTECSTQNSPVLPITLFNSDGTISSCTGSAIDSQHILTAAHCFIFVTVQSASVEFNSQNVFATEVFIHPDVSIDQERLVVFNDVAILKLNRSIGAPVLPLILSRDSKKSDLISIFGFGLDEAGNIGTLRSGEMRLNNVTENHLFAKFGGEGSNTCNGDSGGPALITFANDSGATVTGIAGLTSSGSLETCQAGDNSVFANVQSASILDFITSVVPGVGAV